VNICGFLKETPQPDLFQSAKLLLILIDDLDFSKMKVITTHKNADFDALAAVFAASIVYPDATPVLPSGLNQNVRPFLSIHKDIFPFETPKEIDQTSVSMLIVVDANCWGRLEGMEALKAKRDLTVHLWDHHAELGDIRADWSCRKTVGATTTLLVRRLEEMKASLSAIQASLFLTGIYEDTGNLSFPSTTALDARAVAFLLEQKADIHFINSFLRPVYGPKQKNVLFELLKNARREVMAGHTVSMIKQEVDGHTPGLALVVDMYQDIVNVDAAFGIFTETKQDRTIVIARGNSTDLNIGAIMKSMGGGGHPHAGSAMLKSINPDAVEQWIIELINGNQQTSVQISDLMSFPVATVTSGTSMQDVANLLREKGCSGFPVTEDEKLVGIISRRDFKKVRANQMNAPVKAFMCTDVVYIQPGCSVTQAARLMIKNDIGRLPVVEDGRLIGIITRSDTMRYYYDLLP
jgi:tRNA nucleotidyltransferase (CCA-adding enzyme)